ncbi:uncharacterized protein LOC112198877 [Rosa chinensis]|uniref:uncharacterized protein LOC112198877 n=1 Tax=Rosa chinensis TaxID=74649 RepID=UPI000D088355|nr:uncharacterized protein LOC112198877 [Rosa chinensis]
MADEEGSESRGSSADDVEERRADLISALREMAQALQQTIRAQQQPPPIATDGDTKAMVALCEFKHQKPPAFKGEPDPVVAEQWLDEINKILDALRIRESNSRITHAAYQFTGEAAKWWKMVKRSCNVETMSWDQFCKTFLDKFFPPVLQEAKVEKFNKLYQGKMSAMEYDARFTELSRYAPELVSTEAKKARKFEHGLRPNIRLKVSVLRLPTYAEVLERALIVEADCEEFKKVREKTRQRMGQHSGNPNKKQRTSSSSS